MRDAGLQKIREMVKGGIPPGFGVIWGHREISRGTRPP